MNYQKENNSEWALHIDCYWESHEMKDQKLHVYPTLPEPYINIFFPIAIDKQATLKGISSQSDFFEMRTKLFGVRLFLKGFYQLKLLPSSSVSNRILNFGEIGKEPELELSHKIARAENFEKRMSLFRAYFESKCKLGLTAKQSNIAEAFQFLIRNYKNPRVIKHYANTNGYSPRTIRRWFTSDVGISPKKLSRIIRFHKALEGLHSHKGPGFYLDCGYYDQPQFIREFKEFTGLSPKKYLEMVSDLYN